jgi:hypothetical protein
MTIEPKKKEPKKQYTECLKKDLEWGLQKEKEVKKHLEKYWRCELIETSKMHPLDFVSIYKRCWFEHKGRKNTKEKYPTTMIGYNKVLAGLKEIEKGYEVFFVFSFTDRLCYYQLKEVKEDWIKKNTLGRRDRGKIEINDYYYIPIDELTDVYIEDTTIDLQVQV